LLADPPSNETIDVFYIKKLIVARTCFLKFFPFWMTLTLTKKAYRFFMGYLL